MRILLLFLFIFPASIRAEHHKPHSRAKAFADANYFSLVHYTFYYNPNHYPKHTISIEEAKFNTAKKYLKPLQVTYALSEAFLDFLVSQTEIGQATNSFIESLKATGLHKDLIQHLKQLSLQALQTLNTEGLKKFFEKYKENLSPEIKNILEKFIKQIQFLSTKNKNFKLASQLILKLEFKEFKNLEGKVDPKVYKNAQRLIEIANHPFREMSQQTARSLASLNDLLVEKYLGLTINYLSFLKKIKEEYNKFDFQKSLFEILIPSINSILDKTAVKMAKIDELFYQALKYFSLISSYKDQNPIAWKVHIKSIQEKDKKDKEAFGKVLRDEVEKGVEALKERKKNYSTEDIQIEKARKERWGSRSGLNIKLKK